MFDHIVRRAESSRCAALMALCLLMLTAASTASASGVSYGAGGLPDLSAYRIGTASFDAMAPELGSPVSLDTDGSNHVTVAMWWLPAQGYSAPTTSTTGQRAVQAASGGFFSRMKSQAVGTVAGMVPGVGGVVAAQAANAVAASAIPTTAAGGATPGWWCRAVYPAPGYRLSSVSCSPHAYTPMS
jgi:hypothetical protein